MIQTQLYFNLTT